MKSNNSTSKNTRSTTRNPLLKTRATKAKTGAKLNSKFTKLRRKDQTETAKYPLPKAAGRLIFNQIVLIFTIGCIFGTYYEQILTLVKTFFSTGTVEWLSRRGMVYGPFSPVYGLGAVGIYLLFYRTKANKTACFLGGALLGGVFEYALSWIQEIVFETRSWDYSDRFLNIGGRTTVPYMLFWGLLVLIAVHRLYPMLEQLYNRLEGRTMNVFCTCLAVFMIFDAGLSIAATLRQTERREGDPANTRVEKFLDKHFPDERLKQIYDNAKPVE